MAAEEVVTPADAAEALIGRYVLGDRPVSQRSSDAFFDVYVEALRDFLLDGRTATPLAVSVEGDWGSGKSSLLHLLRQAVARTNAPTVFFDAWRHDKDESLLAGFALEFLRQLKAQHPPWQRSIRESALRISRIDIFDALPQLVVFAVRTILIVAAAIVLIWAVKFAVVSPKVAHALQKAVDDPKEIELARILASAGGFAGLLALIVQFGKALKEFAGNPFEINLEKALDDPSYKARLAFVERFRVDFSRIVRWYSKGRRVFIFIVKLARFRGEVLI